MGPAPWGASCEGRRISAYSQGCRDITSEGNIAMGAKKAKQRELTTVIAAYKHSPAKKLFAHPPQGVGVDADAWGSDSRERIGVDGLEDTLRKLVQHSQGSPRNSLGLPERQEIIAKGALLMASSQNVGLCECHKWDELAVVCNFRSIKAGVNAKVELYVTAVCNTRGENMGCLIAARVGVGARG